MTNQERYKTAEERDKAFETFCRARSECSDCDIKRNYDQRNCCFVWLELEHKDEPLLPCPFCESSHGMSFHRAENGKEEWINCKCGFCTGVMLAGTAIKRYNEIARFALRHKSAVLCRALERNVMKKCFFIVARAVFGFVMGLVVMPLFPLMLASEMADDEWHL